jgi:hypothetical protein
VQRLVEIFGSEVDVPEVALRPFAVACECSGEAAFVEGHTGDHCDVQTTAGREELVLGILIEDVVDDLHGVDQARLEGLDHIRRFPAIHADSERLD